MLVVDAATRGAIAQDSSRLGAAWNLVLASGLSKLDHNLRQHSTREYTGGERHRRPLACTPLPSDNEFQWRKGIVWPKTTIADGVFAHKIQFVGPFSHAFRPREAERPTRGEPVPIASSVYTGSTRDRTPPLLHMKRTLVLVSFSREGLLRYLLRSDPFSISLFAARSVCRRKGVNVNVKRIHKYDDNTSSGMRMCAITRRTPLTMQQPSNGSLPEYGDGGR